MRWNSIAPRMEYIKGQSRLLLPGWHYSTNTQSTQSKPKASFFYLYLALQKSNLQDKFFKKSTIQDQASLPHIYKPHKLLIYRLQQQCPTLSSSNTSPLPAPASAPAKHLTNTLPWTPHPPHRTSHQTSVHRSAAGAARPRGEASTGSGEWEGKPRRSPLTVLDRCARVRLLAFQSKVQRFHFCI